jgi:hypothetical protein
MNDPFETIQAALASVPVQAQREAAEAALRNLIKPVVIGEAFVAAVEKGLVPFEYVQGMVEDHLATKRRQSEPFGL